MWKAGSLSVEWIRLTVRTPRRFSRQLHSCIWKAYIHQKQRCVVTKTQRTKDFSKESGILLAYAHVLIQGVVRTTCVLRFIQVAVCTQLRSKHHFQMKKCGLLPCKYEVRLPVNPLLLFSYVCVDCTRRICRGKKTSYTKSKCKGPPLALPTVTIHMCLEYSSFLMEHALSVVTKRLYIAAVLSKATFCSLARGTFITLCAE